MQKYKKCQNENHQKHVILEGFSKNGLQIRNQRIFFRIVAPVKNYFRHFVDFYIFRATRRDQRDDATTILTILTIL